ncbi:flavin reductase family protein [Marichromatium sp. AB32]|uniref:flavin reductase family protein n=1 Tax=Marichromatium sp. AB32 TaxID=2483363 RepID=UPI000F3E5FB0|nr:flavin reductase family protein [Marichromatium sp. AB32]RNE94585.1 flavin reductase family protein [Marichromatium sp. AB32]
MRAPSPQSAATIAEVFGLYDPPLWLVTASDGARRGGFIASSVTRASIVHEAPRLLLTVARHHHTWGLIERSGRAVLHLLHADDLEAVWRFALASGHHHDKFAGLEVARTPSGTPRYGAALAWLDTEVEQRMEIGDRSVYLLAAHDAGHAGTAAPALTVSGLGRAPDARLAELDRRYAADRATDAEAIRAWRARAHTDRDTPPA